MVSAYNTTLSEKEDKLLEQVIQDMKPKVSNELYKKYVPANGERPYELSSGPSHIDMPGT